MSVNHVIFLALTTLGLIGGSVTENKHQPRQTNEEQSIRLFFDDWLEAERAEDIDRLMEMVDDHCVFLLPGQEPLNGKAAVRTMYERFFLACKGASIDHRVSVQDVNIASDYAFFWGRDELNLTHSTGQVVKAKGYGIGVLRRGADGRWRTFRSMNNITRQPS
ncbi:MAG TPA: SgcJ/EcaC family oxidoreductase [Blastocatellia bacterium]